MSKAHDLYSTGRYAVVDIFYRRIWINTWFESRAHDITTVFRGNISLIVVDLCCFDNYRDDVVDSDVCLNWQIPPIENDKLILKVGSYNPVCRDTITDLSGHLINSPPDTLLTQQQTQDLQQIMLFYLRFKEKIDIENISTDPEVLESAARYQKGIDDIFRTNIDLITIKQQMCEYAGKCLDEFFYLSRTTLEFLGRLYG